MTENILVLGKNGQLAKSFRNHKNFNGYKFIFIGSNDLNFCENIENKLSNIVDKFNPNILINCAAYTLVDQAESEYEKALQINGYSVGSIAKVCCKSNIPLIHYSTDYVFGDSKNDFLLPTDIKKPICAYGESKLFGEKLINNYRKENGLKAIILRISWVFSEFENNFVNTIINLSNINDEISIVNDQFGGPTSTNSVVDITFKIIELIFSNSFSNDNAINSLYDDYHFQGIPITSWYQFASEITNVAFSLGLIKRKPIINPISTSKFKTKAKRQLNSKLSQESLFKLGLKPPNWQKDLNDCLLAKKNAKFKY